MAVDNRTIKLFFICIALIFVIHALFLSTIAEDAFISFRFADNLAHNNMLTWNPGEAPVEGYTNFLWVIIFSFAIRLGIDVISFSQITGILESLLILVYVYFFSQKILGFNKYLSLLPCLFLSISGPFATWAMSGMETNLFTFFVFSGTFHLLAYWKKNKTPSFILSLFLSLLATLTRPEGLGILIILMLIHFLKLMLKKNSGRLYYDLILLGSVYILPFLLYFIWRYSYYGEILPLTYYAKTGGTIFQWIRGIIYSGYFYFHYLLPFAPIIILFVWLKVNEFKLPDILRYFKQSSQLNLNESGLLSIFILCLCYSVYIIYVGGDYMAMYRFFVPVLPFIYILITAAIKAIYESSKISKLKTFFVTALVLIGISGTAIHSTPLEKYFFAKPPITHGQYGGVLIERWHSNRLSLIGHFFNEYKSSEDESLATDAIGAISFYSTMKIFGIHGLDDPVVAKMKEENLGKGFPGHEKINLLHTLSKKPTYFMFSRELTKIPGEFPVYPKDVDKVLHTNYKLVYKWLYDKKNNETGYFTFLERKDKLTK